MKTEARKIAVLRHPKSGVIVGDLYLWNTGEAGPLWKTEEVLDAISEPCSGESPDWAKWIVIIRNGFVAQIVLTEDSPHESSMLAGGYEQLDPYEVQDPQLGRL